MSRTTTLPWLALLLPAPGTAQSPLQDRFFDSDGVRIRYVDAGGGAPVLLIHGFSANLDVDSVGTGIVTAVVVPGADHLTAAGDPAFARALLDSLAAHADTTGSRP